MSLIGNLSSSSQPSPSSGEPPLKKPRREQEEVVNGIRDQSLSFSSKATSDRFLPSRQAMNRAQILDTHSLQTPKTAYAQALMQAIAPYYSSKTLLNQPPRLFQTAQEPKPVWKIPAKPSIIYDAPLGKSLSDFYHHPLDWNRNIYIAGDDSIFSIDPLTLDASFLTSISKDKYGAKDTLDVIVSIKNNPCFDEIGIGNTDSTLSIFDLEKKQMSLIHKVNSQFGKKIFCIDWKKEGTEFTMGLNHGIVHFDKRQEHEAWNLSLELGENTISVNWNSSDVLLGTGNNADLLRVFDVRKIQQGNPIYKFKARAGIKALQWNPVNPQLLAIGAGTADQNLYLIDLKEMKNICKQNIRAQVCDLTWLDEGHFVAATGYGSAASEKLSAWRYIKSIQAIKQIGVMSGLEEGRALNLAQDRRSGRIGSHCSNSDGSKQTLSLWKIENIEKTKEMEKKRNRPPASMKCFDEIR